MSEYSEQSPSGEELDLCTMPGSSSPSRDLDSLTSTLPPPERNDSIITLVDAEGREFHTNIRASDLESLVKFSIIANLNRELREKRREERELERLLKKLDKEEKETSSFSLPKAKMGFSAYIKEKMEPSTYSGVAKRGRPFDSVGKHGSKLQQLLNAPVYHGKAADSRIPSKLKIQPLKRYSYPTKVLPPSPDNVPRWKNNAKNRCRKVYGIEQHHKWCSMCKWKKRCSRFTGNETAEEVAYVVKTRPSSSTKPFKPRRPSKLPDLAISESSLLPPPLSLEEEVGQLVKLRASRLSQQAVIPASLSLPPPCDPARSLEALRHGSS